MVASRCKKYINVSVSSTHQIARADASAIDEALTSRIRRFALLVENWTNLPRTSTILSLGIMLGLYLLVQRNILNLKYFSS